MRTNYVPADSIFCLLSRLKVAARHKSSLGALLGVVSAQACGASRYWDSDFLLVVVGYSATLI